MSSVRLLFFSVLQDLAGGESMDMKVPDDGIVLRDLLELVIERVPDLEKWKSRLLIAVDCEYAEADSLVMPGSEVALMPPVQGG